MSSPIGRDRFAEGLCSTVTFNVSPSGVCIASFIAFSKTSCYVDPVRQWKGESPLVCLLSIIFSSFPSSMSDTV